jgi:hypothetical protein
MTPDSGLTESEKLRAEPSAVCPGVFHGFSHGFSSRWYHDTLLRKGYSMIAPSDMSESGVR